MKQEGQDVANHKTFAKGEPEHLVLAQTKPLPNPFDVRLLPIRDMVGLLRLLGFHCHRSIMAPGYSACVASDASGRQILGLRLNCSQLICTSESGEDTSE